MTKLQENKLTQLCNELMIGVVKTGAVTEKNAELAARIMREELNAFLSGEEYADERICLQNGTVSFQVIWTSVILGAANKIRWASK